MDHSLHTTKDDFYGADRMQGMQRADQRQSCILPYLRSPGSEHNATSQIGAVSRILLGEDFGCSTRWRCCIHDVLDLEREWSCPDLGLAGNRCARQGRAGGMPVRRGGMTESWSLQHLVRVAAAVATSCGKPYTPTPASREAMCWH